MSETRRVGGPRTQREAVEADFWGSSSRPRWLGIVAVAVLLAAWPVGSAAHSGASAPSATRHRDEPSRAEAVAVAAPHSVAVAQATDRVAEAHAAVDQLQQQLAALHIAAYDQNTEVIPLAAADSMARTRTSRYAGVAAGALTARVVDAQQGLGIAEQQQRQALAEYFAAQAAAAAAAEEADRVAREHATNSSASVSASASASSGAQTGGCAGSLACFLACTRAHESDTAGGYQAVSPDGTYRGAYQFDQTTWNSVADSIGRPDLVSVDPASASPANQDTLATALYQMRGNQPWGGRC